MTDSDEPDWDDDDLTEEKPTLSGVRRLGEYIVHVPWFTRLGRKVGPNLRRAAANYLNAMGFPNVGIAPIENWEDAAEAAMSPDWNSDFWDAEEQLRAALTLQAQDALGEDGLEVAMTWIAAQAAEVVLQAVETLDLEDGELAAALAGHASQACHQAALVLAAGADPDHPFALKFRLFEAGRWPIGVTGGSFNLF